MRNNPRETLLKLHRHHVSAWERRNLAQLREIYADEAIVFHTHPPSRFADFKTFENNIVQYFGGMEQVSILTSNIQIEVQDGAAWVSSLYLKTFRSNGESVRQTGRWTEIYAQDQEGRWKLVHFHASEDPGEIG